MPSPPSTPPANRGLIVSDVSHRFGDFVAADEVSLEVAPGQVHCLLGPSGSGKSTLLRLIAGLEILRSGSISIDGVEVGGPRCHRRPEERSVGFVFQDYALFPHLDVRRNVLFGMTGGDKASRRHAADALLERVDMADYATAMPHTLSGGQQQRVALARSLAREPSVMLLDEPFSGLDARLRGEVRRATLDILRKAGVATLMVTHDPREALSAGDLVSVIRAGRLVQTGSPDEVYHHSKSCEVAEVFGPINRILGHVRGGRAETRWGSVATTRADGSDVEILVRPACLRLTRADGIDENSDQGTITDVENTGALSVITVDCGEQILAVEDLSHRGWHPGDEVRVHFDAGDGTLCGRPGCALELATRASRELRFRD